MNKQEYQRAWVAKNPTYFQEWEHKHAGTRMARKLARRRAVTEFIRQQKVGKQCALCGENDAKRLVFHHRDPATKLFSLGDTNTRPETLERIIEEIGKCVLWCKPCHDKYHAQRRKAR